MSTLLHLSTIRDNLPYIFNAAHIISVCPQPYVDNDDTWATGTALMSIAGKEFTVAEPCEVVTQMWQAALGEHAKNRMVYNGG